MIVDVPRLSSFQGGGFSNTFCSSPGYVTFIRQFGEAKSMLNDKVVWKLLLEHFLPWRLRENVWLQGPPGMSFTEAQKSGAQLQRCAGHLRKLFCLFVCLSVCLFVCLLVCFSWTWSFFCAFLCLSILRFTRVFLRWNTLTPTSSEVFGEKRAKAAGSTCRCFSSSFRWNSGRDVEQPEFLLLWGRARVEVAVRTLADMLFVCFICRPRIKGCSWEIEECTLQQEQKRLVKLKLWTHGLQPR